MRPSASATAVGDPGSLSPYWRFHQAVAEAQLASWLPRESRLLVDISGPRACAAEIAAAAGHTVLRVTETAGLPARAARRRCCPRSSRRPARRLRPGRIVQLASDPASLSFLRDGCADGVIAEDRTLSRQLAAENLITDIARVLRPAGRVLGLRRLPRPGHGPARRATALGGADRPPARRGGARAMAGRHDHPLLRRRAASRAVRGRRAHRHVDPAAHRVLPVDGRARAAPGPQGPAAPGGSRARDAARRVRRRPARRLGA